MDAYTYYTVGGRPDSKVYWRTQDGTSFEVTGFSDDRDWVRSTTTASDWEAWEQVQADLVSEWVPR